MRAHQPRTTLPWLLPRKGFAWLPLAEQLAVVSLIGVFLLAVLPVVVDPRPVDAGSLLQSLHWPTTTADARGRLERHYSFSWWKEMGSNEWRVRGKLLVITLGTILLGSVAGSVAKRPPRPSTTPLCYGGASTIRTRAALQAYVRMRR